MQHLKDSGAFLIRMGMPTVARRWTAATIRQALADGSASTIPDIEPDYVDDQALALQADLLDLGWKDLPISMSLEAGWPQFQARIPLADEDGRSRDLDGVLSGMSSSARKSMRKSARSGVEVNLHGPEALEDFYALHHQTAQRHGFTPRSKEGVRTLMDALASSGIAETKIFLAEFEGRSLRRASTWARARAATPCMQAPRRAGGSSKLPLPEDAADRAPAGQRLALVQSRRREPVLGPGRCDYRNHAVQDEAGGRADADPRRVGLRR
ncbi:aminoacyltransferase [Nesterenkonia pannonica]|uniref:aminoacyltransferase n=1 Tax=Nesterenkonia pannonica TaxID=1548602 RepID=UPI0021643E3D|nr:aminoacyltransferase [Nesterenkonia pannonica]